MKLRLSKYSRYGTYGFMSLMLAGQVGMMKPVMADSTVDKVDRAATDAKKDARSVKRDVKKRARQLKGDDNLGSDIKDNLKDAGKNVQDEVDYQKRKQERKD